IFMKRIQEGKIRSYPFIKVFPDGTIDWKNDGFTRALMAELPDRVKKHIESIESYDTTREAILNDIPLRKWFRNKNRDLEIRQQKKAKKYMASMKKVVTYSSLDQGRMDRRKGEMDLSGGRWEWKYGDGVGVVALAGNSLRREVAAIQRELRDVVRSRMRQIAGRDPSEEEMNRVLQLTDPDTVHMTVSEDIPNTRQIDPSRADERVSMMRKISGILSDSKINVMFNVSDVSILEDGSILIFGREVDDSLETLRGAIAKETQGDETRRKRIQHITIGRIFDKEKLGQEAYYHMREILRMRSKRGGVEVPMDPSLRVWDQAGAFGTSGGGRYVEPREILDIFSERQEPSRDLSGTMAPESDQLIKSLIKDGRIAEVFLVKGQLAVRRIKYVEGHVPGRASAEDYLGEDLDPADIFTKEQAENIEGWMKGKTLPDERGDVRFRIILGGAAIGWNTDAEHISVSHAGYRDGVIYIGGRLLASIFTESHDPVRMLILDQDEYRHLTEKDFDCRLDTEAYKSRLSEAINRIKAINDTNPDRPRTDICPDAATARERHYGVDKEDPNIKWGNFTPQDKDLIRDDMSPVNVAASLFILDGTDVPEDRLRMKIWMGPDDNYFRWSEKKMQLVYRNIVEGGTVYYFEGELPAFFHGDFTFKYSVDGGTRWRWANRGPGDDLKLRRTMFDESKAKIGAYGLWRGDGQRADYKRAKIFTLYKGNVNLKALVDKARDVDDVFWETWKVPSGEAGKNKVIFAGHSTDDEGNNEGSVLVMYNDMSRTISVIMRGDYEDAIIPGTDRKLSSTDWYRSVVEIRLDERFRAKEVFHRPELMGISRSGMALLMLHAGIDREEYAGLFRLLQEELVLYPVSPKMKLEDTYDMKPIEVGAIVKIMDDPDGALDISLDEIDSLERIIEFARSKTLTRLALACLEILAEQGRYRKDLYREKERYVTEKMVLEGMASVERVIRQDKTILREMGIDRAAVKSVAVRWFAGGVNKMIYRVTFRMHDKAAKVFAMEFMSPVRLGEDFMMTNVEKPINIWERKLSDAGFDFVPHVFSVKRISDYKPKILEEPLPRMAERTSNWDFAMDPAVMDPARALYDDTLIVAREYVEGQEALEYAASVSPNAEEEKRINLAALTAYLRMWKATKDPVTGRGAGLMEPDKSNVVVYVQSSGYHGMVADFHSLSYGLGLKDLIRMLHHNKFTKEECAEAARGVLNDEECALAGKVLEEIDEAHPDDMITEERPFMLAVSDVPDETLQEVSRGILEYPERSGLKLNAEQQRLSMHGIKGALSYLAERINRNMDISPGIKDNLAITVDQMRRREIWTKVQYYKARWGHDLILGGRMPVYDMLYAFKHEDAFHLAEGFLDGTGVSREECVALVILRHIVAEMFPEKDRDELRDIVGKVIGEESTLHIDGLIKRYAARSYIKILLEDDVLGIGPEKDLITYQALADTREAARNAEEYLETVTWITMREARLEDISSREALAEYLTKRFGVRKFIIAGGKGTRFSPEGIVVKQLFRPDNDNTNIKLSRISASFGKLDDVIVVDTVTLFNVIAADREIDEDTRALAADEAAEAVQEFVKEGVISKTEAARLIRDVTVKSKRDLRYSRRSDGLMDLAMFIRSITGSAKLILGESDERVQFVTDKIAYAVFKAVMKQENIIDEEKKDEFFGKNSIVVLDAGDGHGSAYMEALERLEAEGKIGNARYSIIMHADSPGWGLEEYPDAVFITYLKTVNGLYPGSEELPKASIAVKNPVDGRAKNRARIFIDRTEEYGAIPLGIKEWNCMTEEERSGSSSMASSRDPNLLTNANILICDTPWAYSRREILRRDYRHMLGDQSRKKRRAYEYWSSDLLNIAASEYLERKTRGETAAPATRMVYFGQHAPNANKILKYALEYRDSLQEMITNKILAMGVDVDRYAEVSISSNEIIPGFDWDKAVHDIFKDNLSSDDGARALGNIKIRGRVHLDAAARVGRGAILDGSKDDIWLTGRTRVERGVEIHGVIAHDERITSDRIYEQEKKLVTSFPVNGYRTREATLVNNVDLSGLGFIADSRTRIWLIKSNRSRSDEEALMDIFGGEIEGTKVRDQIFLYGDIILEDTVRVESGTMLDGRSGGVTLLGNTRVRKGTILKDVKARDTIFASRRGMDIYYYKQPTSIKEKFWLSDSVFENAYVEWSAKVQNSTVVNSCVMGEAQVLDSDIFNDLISQDSSVSGVRREDRENMLSALFSSGRNASLRYVPGAYRLDEFEEVDRNEVKNYQLAFAKRLYGMTIKNEYVLTRMTEDTERFLFSGAADCLTLQQIREYFFAKVRYNSLKYEGKEPGISEIKEFTDIMREYAGPYVKKAASISLSDREAASALLKEIMLKSARANLLDPSMDTGLFDMMEASGTARLSGAEKLIEEKTMDHAAIDGFTEIEKLVLTPGKGTFIFFPDNIGEIEFDAAIWMALLKLGHKVVVAPKSGFAFGDADRSAAEEMIEHYRLPGELRDYYLSGALKVVDSGSLGEGFIPHKMSRELFEALGDPELKAIISKGQANLFTLTSRNTVKVPV
ncbi:MAG: hypothetical protein PHW14_04625, partial [Candidatus Omnitrophica bacterium]|nr:hypothetical protein [Candidatus Omnitrophota bacterium]